MSLLKLLPENGPALLPIGPISACDGSKSRWSWSGLESGLPEAVGSPRLPSARSTFRLRADRQRCRCQRQQGVVHDPQRALTDQGEVQASRAIGGRRDAR